MSLLLGDDFIDIFLCCNVGRSLGVWALPSRHTVSDSHRDIVYVSVTTTIARCTVTGQWPKFSSFLITMHTYIHIYRMSQEECARFRESVPYVKLYRYNPKHLYPKLNGYGDNGQRSMKFWQLLFTYWLPNTYWNWQEYVVSVMLIAVRNIKVTCE